jgi:hypothetical protein
VTVEDFLKLKEKLEHNARPTMPLAALLDADWVNNRKSDYFPEL